MYTWPLLLKNSIPKEIGELYLLVQIAKLISRQQSRIQAPDIGHFTFEVIYCHKNEFSKLSIVFSMEYDAGDEYNYENFLGSARRSTELIALYLLPKTWQTDS